MQIPPGPGLGVLRHLRPVDDLAEGVVVVDDDKNVTLELSRASPLSDQLTTNP